MGNGAKNRRDLLKTVVCVGKYGRAVPDWLSDTAIAPTEFLLSRKLAGREPTGNKSPLETFLCYGSQAPPD